MRTIAVIVVALVVLTSCHKNSPTSPSASGLPGAWRATRAEYVSGSQRVDVIPRGSTMTLTLETSTFALTVTDPGEPAVVTSGTWSASRDVLTLKPTGMTGEIQFDMTLSGSTLSLNGGHVLYDINSDDRDEECILNTTLVRQ